MWYTSLFRSRASIPSRPARFGPGVERLGFWWTTFSPAGTLRGAHLFFACARSARAKECPCQPGAGERTDDVVSAEPVPRVRRAVQDISRGSARRCRDSERTEARHELRAALALLPGQAQDQPSRESRRVSDRQSSTTGPRKVARATGRL